MKTSTTTWNNMPRTATRAQEYAIAKENAYKTKRLLDIKRAVEALDESTERMYTTEQMSSTYADSLMEVRAIMNTFY